MPGNKCQYFNCSKTTTKYPNISMFRFPKDERHEIWIINSGNVNLLSLDKTQLYNRYICQEHFAPASFMNNLNKNLKPKAIPYKCNSEKLPSTSRGNNLELVDVNKELDEIDFQSRTLTPNKIYSRTRSDITELIFPSPSSIYDTSKRNRINDLVDMPSLNSKRMMYTNEDTPRKIKLNKKIDEQKNKLYNSISWNRNITNDDTSSISIQLFRSESTPPSLLSSELATPRQISTILTDGILSNQSDELRKLKVELEVQKTLVSSLGEKYNALALKHLQYKSKRKMQIEALKGNLEADLCQMESLKTQLSIQKRRLKTEEEFRKQVETDYRTLQEEKRNADYRISVSENEVRNIVRHLNVLQRKVKMLESANADLLSKHLHLVYKDLRMPKKSTTCDCIITAISDDKNNY